SAPDAQFRTRAELEDALPWADIVIACLPGTEETRGFFTQEMIDRMRADAIFCNIGRGSLLAGEEALASALERGRLGGAVLDVTAQEPLPPDHRFWTCPRIILSQHTGGGTASEFDGMIGIFLQNLALFREGRPLLNQVQLERGY